MNNVYRIEVWPKKERSTKIEEIPLYWIATEAPLKASELKAVADVVFTDSVIEIAVTNQDEDVSKIDFKQSTEVSFRPGVTDNSANSAREGVELTKILKTAFKVASGKMFLFKENITKESALSITNEVFANPLLQKINLVDWSKRFEVFHFPDVILHAHEVETINLNLSDRELIELSTQKTWALSIDEMKQARDYFTKRGTPPTDVEMEIIAQTWSEHCKHKIFASNIDYSESASVPAEFKKFGAKKIKSIFKTYIKDLTEEVKRERKLNWLVSVFSDNAGILRFDEHLDVCIKVETHNSPSALDPYGGALTGILGVNRDILGAGLGAFPIANTDVFCFSEERENVVIPDGLKKPSRIFSGVHKGVEDGGNKSGIPTVNGAIHFDDNYAGKPLVYCGTLGVIPHTINGISSEVKGQKVGDVIVMAGGAIGADGIHGATFSSMELTEGAPATVVQIGDPLTQKRLLDFLMEARDLGLYSGVTDNGAGGLSSSLGEMAQATGGAIFDLKKARVKYPGLSPFELMISESQERMSLAVPPENLDSFLDLAKRRGVSADVLGKFTNTGNFEVYYGEQKVANLDLHFLHESLIPMELKAEWSGPIKKTFWHGKNIDRTEKPSSLKEALLRLLSRPNIASKEKYVRQYDHEVKASTVVKPFTGIKADGPSDAGVIWLAPHGGEEKNAVAVASGLCPQFSHVDPYLMAQYAVDESVRNLVATGANPEELALVDNFCWPDPIESNKTPDGRYKLAQLVRTCEGLYETARTYGAPMVSGKDSMKNDFTSKGVKISIPPTLLMTAVARVPNVEKVMTSDFKDDGDLVYLLGKVDDESLTTGEFTHCYGPDVLSLPTPDLKQNFDLYKKIFSFNQQFSLASCHDLSEGGLLVSLAESLIGGRLGLSLDLSNKNNKDAWLFNEVSGAFIVSLKPKYHADFEKHFSDLPKTKLGQLYSRPILRLESNQGIDEIEVQELVQAFKGGR